jgi:ABC-2 type transport system permease protein
MTSIVGSIFWRELRSYFATPLAYVFIVIFLVVTGIFTFYMGSFYERGQADLTPFFTYHPWLYLFLVPAVAMRLWAEERKSGSIELLLTLPIRNWQAVLGKFLAAWFFTGLALTLTFPLWLTVNYLGEPDNGVIVAAYLGSWLMVGAYLAIGSCISASTNNQVIAFILTVTICFLFVAAGSPIVMDLFTSWSDSRLWSAIASTSFLVRFEAISKGVLDFRDVFYFLLMITLWLAATVIVIDMKKSQ